MHVVEIIGLQPALFKKQYIYFF